LKIRNALRARLFAGRAALRNCAKTRESHESDISLITGIRLIERRIQVDKPAGFRIGHALFERFRDPGIIIFRDKLGDLRPLASGKGFELLDNFSGTHGEKNIAPNRSSQNRSSPALNL
jgi:hypothetical protein